MLQQIKEKIVYTSRRVSHKSELKLADLGDIFIFYRTA